MRLAALTATADAVGNRITVTWTYPDDHPAVDGVRMVRRADRFPASPTDGFVVADSPGTRAIDTGLRGETVYYYALFPYTGSPKVFDVDERNRASALATSPFDHAGQMYALLPALYQRFDTDGLLRRLLDLPGGQLDVLRGLTQSLLDQHTVDRVDGALLPLLAQWIGWRPDVGVDLAARRNELREAPAIYRTIGLMPTLEATVKRILGRKSRTKEYVHNVAHSNAPERRVVWARRRTGAGAGTWSGPGQQPFSVDNASAGRPTTARDSTGRLWFLHHTLRNGRWQVWVKSAPPGGTEAFEPSEPLSPAPAPLSQIDPSAVALGSAVWAFWSTYDPRNDRWQIRYRIHGAAGWGDDIVFGTPDTDRRRPAAATDGSNVWLFWQERRGGDWLTRYARHDGAAWSAAVTFPLDGAAAPRVESDPVAIGGLSGSPALLWLFWTRRESGRTKVFYRTKSTTAADANGWSAVTALTGSPSGADDREPAPVVTAGRVELFWSSNRGGSWSVWHSNFNQAGGTWNAPDQVTTGPFNERGPAPLPTPAGLWLFTGANRPVTYNSDLYRATLTVDARYCGTTTVDTRNTAKLALRGHLDDFATYSYATGTGPYGYDTVGVFLDPAIDLPQQVGRSAHLAEVQRGLRAFIPAHVRVILIDSPS